MVEEKLGWYKKTLEKHNDKYEIYYGLFVDENPN